MGYIVLKTYTERKKLKVLRGVSKKHSIQAFQALSTTGRLWVVHIS